MADELAAYGVGPAWHRLGDRAVATHLVRTEMLEAGYPLSAVTEALCARWQPGARLLPVTDDRVETHVAVADPAAPSGRRVVHLQEYRATLGDDVPVEALLVVGLDSATPAPGVLEALAAADLLLLAASDPVATLGPVLGVPGVRKALLASPAPVVGLSPVVAGRVVAGPPGPAATRLLDSAGLAADAAAVALHLGLRGAGGVLDGWVLDERDAGRVPALAAAGIRTGTAPVGSEAVEDAVAVLAAAVAVAGAETPGPVG